MATNDLLQKVKQNLLKNPFCFWLHSPGGLFKKDIILPEIGLAG